MASKEAVYGVVKSINNTIPDANGNVNVVCEDIILNDLEVLEILKKYINIINNGFTLCGNYYDEKDFKKEDFRKIIGWLKND
ncbi:MAG: hypothetical protein J6W64_07225 [Bacilli bacterium]|nr:hypothetical protein [Bacilli bacterium]